MSIKRKREIHGMGKTSEYQAWKNMKDRCLNINSKKYKRYGKRNITICKEWKNSFINFYKDMGPKPFPRAEIDRENNDGNYNKNNCRWTTSAINTQNRSTTKLSMVKAKEIRIKHSTGNYTQLELSIIYNINYTSVNRVINNKTWKE